MNPEEPQPDAFRTTYQYRPLESPRHIRLLQVLYEDGDIETVAAPKYRIVHRRLPTDNENEEKFDFEAVSYTWGNPDRVARLEIAEEAGGIGLTRNLEIALPYLAKHSNTKLLWIDQLCLNQGDNVEKSTHLGMMSEIYNVGSRVMIWLGPEDEDSRVCKEWLSALTQMLQKMEHSHKMLHDSPTFNPDIRYLVVRSTFVSPTTDAKFAPAIRRFWSRPWFSRGWVVQELLLGKAETFYTGDLQFTMNDFADMQTVPSDSAPGNENQEWFSYNILMNLKLHSFTDDQPLRFLRLMYQASQEFQTSVLRDRLYAFLGMIEGSDFIPDYILPIKTSFTRFTASMAENFGSIDFLSMWSSNLDELLPGTPKELKGLPSWVPSWSAIPLSAPYRLAVGGVRSLRYDILWNAASRRRHVQQQQQNEVVATGRLYVRGKIIDYVDAISSARFHKYWDADNDYMDDLVRQIRQDIPELQSWTLKDMIHFLNTVAANGDTPRETAEKVLGLKEKAAWTEVTNMAGYNESLALCLSMGRGRRFMRTEKGKIGLAPYIGTKPRSSEGESGSPIVILHGCIVPIVLERVKEKSDEYKVLGDCYVEGIMKGEAVSWNEEDAETFVLV